MGLAVGVVAGPGHDGVGTRDWRGRRGDGRGPERARGLRFWLGFVRRGWSFLGEWWVAWAIAGRYDVVAASKPRHTRPHTSSYGFSRQPKRLGWLWGGFEGSSCKCSDSFFTGKCSYSLSITWVGLINIKRYYHVVQKNSIGKNMHIQNIETVIIILCIDLTCIYRIVQGGIWSRGQVVKAFKSIILL